jgi:Uncharacterised nucleotidyltransferase
MRRDWVGPALRACVREHDWSRAPDGLDEIVGGRDLGDLTRRAAYHGVVNLVYLSLRPLAGADPDAVSLLEREYVAANARHLRALADLATVALALDDAGIRWLLFKGPILTEVVYPRRDLRSYLDLDVVVAPRDFPDAVDALQQHGAGLLDRNWDLLLGREAGQLHFQLPFGTLADLHWHVVNRTEIRRSLSVSMSDLLARARPTVVGSTPVLTFDHVDFLLHLCIHAALSGGVRVTWLKDIERSVAACHYSPDEVLERAKEWRAGAPVAAMLGRVRRLFGPESIPPELMPQSSTLARAADTAFDKLFPVTSMAGDRGAAAYWMRYKRDTFALGRDTLLARMSLRGPAPGRKEPEGSAVLVASGNAHTRAAYFEMVARYADAAVSA